MNDLSAFDDDAERERQICDLRVKGKTEREVCDMLGVTVPDIHRALDRAAQAAMTPEAARLQEAAFTVAPGRPPTRAARVGGRRQGPKSRPGASVGLGGCQPNWKRETRPVAPQPS